MVDGPPQAPDERTRRQRKRAGQFQRFFETSPDLLSIVGLDGSFVEVNSAWSDVLGWSPDEMVGRAFLDFVHADDVERSREEQTRLEQAGRPAVFENRYRTKDGGYRCLAWVAHHADDEGLFYCVARDVTHAKRLQGQHEVLLEVALATAKAADLEAALDVVLERLCQRFGWLVGEVWLPDDARRRLSCGPAWYAHASALYGGGDQLAQWRKVTEGLRFERGVGLPGLAWSRRAPAWLHEVRDPGPVDRLGLTGDSGLTDGLALPVFAEDRLVAVLVLFGRDDPSDDRAAALPTLQAIASQLGVLFERRQHDDARDQALAAYERAERDLRELTAALEANVADPLDVLAGEVQDARALVDRGEPDRAIELLERAAGRALAARRELASLATWAEAGTIAPTIEHADAGVAFREALAELATLVKGRGAKVTTTALPSVRADPEHLQRLFVAMIARAVRRGPDSGPLVAVRAERRGRHWLFHVVDNGAPLEHTRNSRPFDVTNTPGVDPGTAAPNPLAVARRIVEAHGGRIGLETLPERGAEVWFTLPAVDVVER